MTHLHPDYIERRRAAIANLEGDKRKRAEEALLQEIRRAELTTPTQSAADLANEREEHRRTAHEFASCSSAPTGGTP